REPALAADSSTFQHALLLLRTGDMDGAKQWLQIAANGGHVRAMTLLGLYYADFGCQPSAIRRLTSAADAGGERALDFLRAIYYARGDLAAAVHWWGRAAQLGNPAAMYNLGELLISAGYTRDGEGWVRAAAEAGHERALTRLVELAGRSTVPEQRADPASRPDYRYSEPAGRPAQQPDYGYESGDRPWYGEQATLLPEPDSPGIGLVASAGLPADPRHTTSHGYAASSGFAAGPGFAARSGHLTPGFSSFR